MHVFSGWYTTRHSDLFHHVTDSTQRIILAFILIIVGNIYHIRKVYGLSARIAKLYSVLQSLQEIVFDALANHGTYIFTF